MKLEKNLERLFEEVLYEASKQDLMNREGDVVTINWSNALNNWVVSREKCRRGAPPIGDARFRFDADPEDSAEDIIGYLTNMGFPKDDILVLNDKT